MKRILQQFTVCLVVSWLIANPAAWATTYYVNNTHVAKSDSNAGTSSSLPWATIGKCAATIVAGDTCSVVAGTYDETVTETTSNVTYTGNARVAVVRNFILTGTTGVIIREFEITNAGMSSSLIPSIRVSSTTNVQILDNYFHDTLTGGADAAIYAAADLRAVGLQVVDNDAYGIGAPGDRRSFMIVDGTGVLVEGNTIQRTFDMIQAFGNHWVLRNNIMHNALASDTMGNHHIDAIQSFCVAALNESLNYALIEGNKLYDLPDSDTHLVLNNTTLTCVPTTGTRNVLIRYNNIYQVGEAIFGADTNNQGSSQDWKFYNNTTVRTGPLAGNNPEAPSIPPANIHESVTLTGVTNGEILNNIFVDSIADTGPYTVYAFKAADATSTGNCNLARMSSGAKTWGSLITSEATSGTLLNLDPEFTNSAAGDFTLQATSDAINVGCPLTTVAVADIGTGTTLVLNDAGFFQDGWAGVLPDQIAVGTVGNTATIASIDYDADTVTLASAITRTDGQNVWLAKKSDGITVLVGAAPDLGAFEFGGAAAPAPTLASVVPASGLVPSTVSFTLTGTDFDAGSGSVAISGAGITVQSVVVVGSTTITGEFVLAVGAALTARTVTVTTVDGTSNTATFQPFTAGIGAGALKMR